MPYMYVRAGGKVRIHKRGPDGQPEGKALGTHDDMASAKRQMAVLHAAEAQERTRMAKYDGIDFRPTDDMARCATRALEQAGGRPSYRTLAEQISRRDMLSARAVRLIARNAAKADSDDDINYRLCGGTAGAVWARQRAAQMAEREDSMKALNTSDAGSLGFGVPADQEGVAERAATAKYHVKQVVVVKALALRGIITGVKPVKGGVIVYTVKTLDGGFTVCTTEDLEAVASKSAVKTGSLVNALKAVEACDPNQQAVDACLRALQSTQKAAGDNRIAVLSVIDALRSASSWYAEDDPAAAARGNDACLRAKSEAQALRALLAENVAKSYDTDLERALSLVDNARASLRVDTEPQRRAVLRTLNKLDLLLDDLAMNASPQAQQLIHTAVEALMTLTDASDAIPDPKRTPLRVWIAALNDVRRALARAQMLRGQRSVTGKSAVKSLLDAAAAWDGSEDTMTPVEDAAEVVRALVQRDQPEALERVIVLESAVYDDSKTGTDWLAAVTTAAEAVFSDESEDNNGNSETTSH